jgi:aarF domain-containing kinase
MRPAVLLGRLCLRNGFPVLRSRPTPPPLRRCASAGFRGGTSKAYHRRVPIAGPVLLAALSPAAFVKLNEEAPHGEWTGERLMLEASREELREKIPDGVHGLPRAWQKLILILDYYVYEPMATGFRFLHLVLIFVPVIVSVPAVWLGRRQKDRDNERSGTIWWYGFLVRSMERAGAAFIKVRRGR